jgi:hypothetical protein
VYSNIKFCFRLKVKPLSAKEEQIMFYHFGTIVKADPLSGPNKSLL